MSPAGLLFALGAARVCAPSRPWRLDGAVVTDATVRVRWCTAESVDVWVVDDGGRTRVVDASGLLRTLARLGEDAGTEEAGHAATGG